MILLPKIAFWVGTMLPSVLMLLEHLKEDPEANVSNALQKLRAEQEQAVLQKQAFDVEYSEDKARRYKLPVTQGIATNEAVRQGLYDPELGIGKPREGTSQLLQDVADQLGMTPQDLKSRFDPRRIGDMGELTRSALFQDNK